MVNVFPFATIRLWTSLLAHLRQSEMVGDGGGDESDVP